MPSIESKQFYIYPMPIVKGICILSIILLHASGSCFGANHYSLLLNLGIFANCLTRFAVPLFVMLSGFYLRVSSRNDRAIPFYRRTLKYFIIPYCIYSLIYSLPGLLKHGDFIHIVTNLLTASASPHLWFALLILQFYILHPFLSRLYQVIKRPKSFVIFMLFLQIAYTFALSMIFHNPDPLGSSAVIAQRLGAILFISNIAYFLVGYFLLDKADDLIPMFQDRRIVLAGGLMWLLAGFGLFIFWGIPISKGILAATILPASIAQSFLIPFLGFAAFIVIYSFVQNRKPGRNRLWGLLHSFGLYAYGIYYFHELSSWLLLWMARRFPIIHLDNAALHLFLFPAIAILTLISVKLLARLPIGKYLA